MSETGEQQSRAVSFAERNPHLKGLLELLPQLNKESDRGLALIVCGYLDQLIKDILLAFFIDGKNSSLLVEGFNAPLGKLSTRISAAYALGLISEREFKECTTLRKIRNEFAHKVHVSFETLSIRDLSGNLTMSILDDGTMKIGARGRFHSAAVSLISHLTNRAAYVSRKRTQYGNWPL